MTTWTPETIEAWLDEHEACILGRRWLEANGFTTSLADAWRACSRPDWMLWALGRFGPLDGATVRLWATACVRELGALLDDEPFYRECIDVAERYARNQATDDERLATICRFDAVPKPYGARRLYVRSAVFAILTGGMFAVMEAPEKAASALAEIGPSRAKSYTRQSDLLREFFPNPFEIFEPGGEDDDDYPF